MKAEKRQQCWLGLNYLVSEGLLSAGKALQLLDRAEGLFPPDETLLDSLRIRPAARQKLCSGDWLDRAEAELEKLVKKEYTLLTFEDDRYPRLLREVVEPPLVLYCFGQPEILSWAAVAVVGSRKPSPYGKMLADRLSEELAACGLVVVSGLARGIDTLAHRGALRGGRTVAVLGSGLENIYPKENRMLADRIAEKGAVVSEYPLDSEPLGFHFPLRNRVISGLSLACLVVEASLKSGALITARLAADQGREVLAVPGPVDSELSRGTNFLLKQGARLAESAEDVLLELPSPWKEAALSRLAETKRSRPELAGREKEVYQALPETSLIHIDELSDKIQVSVAELLTVLLGLEMKDLVVQEAGKFFRRRL